MALTQLQASNQYISDSIGYFLDRRVKTAYDTAVSALSWNTVLKVRQGSPDDESVVLSAPVIAYNTLEPGDRERTTGIGSSILYREQPFVLYCYPSLTTKGLPNLEAAELLKSKVLDALNAAEFIRVVDYSNPSTNPSNVLFAPDNMQIIRRAGPMPRGGASNPLAQERHRFDYHFTVKYPVIEPLVN